MAQWLRITVDGDIETVEIDGLKSMYREIGRQCSLVELLTAPDGTEFWIDEEGKLVGYPKPNVLATTIAADLGLGLMEGDVLCGDVLIGRSLVDDEGESEYQDVPEALRERCDRVRDTVAPTLSNVLAKLAAYWQGSI